MEIKKGISQMAEYPNREINYVIPIDGQMYYVLEDGVLANGCVIATLNPKRAIDSSITTNDIGVFAEDGSVLIDFNKKDIKKINDDYLLVVESVPRSELVINALKNEEDEISKTTIKDNSASIVDKMLVEMGVSGEVLFSDAYGEANIYKTDSVNNKIGEGFSFIGKNNDNFYLHTSDVSTETEVYSIVDGKKIDNVVADSTMESVNLNSLEPAAKEEDSVENGDNSLDQSSEQDNKEEVLSTNDFSINSEALTEDASSDSLETENNDVKLDINKSFLDEFKFVDDDKKEVIEDDSKEDSKLEDNNTEIDYEESDKVLDNAIAVMKKMIEETAKLNNRISELEKQLEEKEKVISNDMSKKNALNNLLDEANEVLEKID